LWAGVAAALSRPFNGAFERIAALGRRPAPPDGAAHRDRPETLPDPLPGGRQATLARMLISVVDHYDPYAAHHAARVGDLSARIAERMGLDEVACETAAVSGTLLHLGVPLASEGPIVPDNGGGRHPLRAGLQSLLGLLDALSFTGPVTETLRQLRRCVDGQGLPLGPLRSDVPISARIVQVASGLAGMVSRGNGGRGLPLNKALAELDRHGNLCDRRVMAALRDYLDNKGGRAAWQAIPARRNGS
jgi:hypothetical protein